MKSMKYFTLITIYSWCVLCISGAHDSSLFFNSPELFQCVENSTITPVFSWRFVIADEYSPLPYFCMLLDGGMNSKHYQCSQLSSQNGISHPAIDILAPGCHLAIAWFSWNSNGEGEMISQDAIIFEIAGTNGCQGSCSSPDIPMSNPITGGCFNSEHCCGGGCCEYLNNVQICIQNVSNQALPPCSLCMKGTHPPKLNMLINELYQDEQSRMINIEYLSLIKNVVLNTIYTNMTKNKMDGNVWQSDINALTMVGSRRLDNVQALLNDVILRGVKGDVAECGCWKGGVAAYFIAILRSAGELRNSNSQNNKRTVWLLDSFQGLPEVDIENYPKDLIHKNMVKHVNPLLNSENNSNEDSVINNLKRIGLYDEYGTRVIKGFFKDSIPLALKEGKLCSLSILRLDGDLYESTIQSLHYLYPLLSISGHVIVDDFTGWIGCRQAIIDFRLVHGIGEISSSKQDDVGTSPHHPHHPHAREQNDIENFIENIFSSTTKKNQDSKYQTEVDIHRIKKQLNKSLIHYQQVNTNDEMIQIVCYDVFAGEVVNGIWWTKTKHIHYDPLSESLRPEDYHFIANFIREKMTSKPQ